MQQSLKPTVNRVPFETSVFTWQPGSSRGAQKEESGILESILLKIGKAIPLLPGSKNLEKDFAQKDAVSWGWRVMANFGASDT